MRTADRASLDTLETPLLKKELNTSTLLERPPVVQKEGLNTQPLNHQRSILQQYHDEAYY